MNYTFQDFNPVMPILIIDGMEIPLAIVSLKHQLHFESKYGDLQAVLDSVKDKPDSLLDIVWALVHDKSVFNYRQSEFNTLFLSKDIIENSKKAFACLHDCITRSLPLIKNTKRFKDIQDLKKAQSDDQSSSSCYANMYDSLAKRYSYSIDDFYNLSVRQLHILLEKIGDNQYTELEIQASLAGKRLKPRMTFSDLTEEEEQDNDEQAMKAFKQLQKNYQEGKK